MIKNLTTLEKAALSTLLFIAAMYFFDSYIYSRRIADVARLEKRLVSLNNEIASHVGDKDERFFESERQKVRKRISELENNIDNTKFIKAKTDNEITSLVRAISTKATDNHLMIVSQVPGEKLYHSCSPELKKYKEIPSSIKLVTNPDVDFFDWQEFSLEFEGQYLDLINFIWELKALPYSVLIERIQVVESEKHSGKIRIVLEMLF